MKFILEDWPSWFSQVNVVCDWISLTCMQKRHYYREEKFTYVSDYEIVSIYFYFFPALCRHCALYAVLIVACTYITWLNLVYTSFSNVLPAFRYKCSISEFLCLSGSCPVMFHRSSAIMTWRFAGCLLTDVNINTLITVRNIFCHFHASIKLNVNKLTKVFVFFYH